MSGPQLSNLSHVDGSRKSKKRPQEATQSNEHTDESGNRKRSRPSVDDPTDTTTRETLHASPSVDVQHQHQPLPTRNYPPPHAIHQQQHQPQQSSLSQSTQDMDRGTFDDFHPSPFRHPTSQHFSTPLAPPQVDGNNLTINDEEASALFAESSNSSSSQSALMSSVDSGPFHRMIDQFIADSEEQSDDVVVPSRHETLSSQTQPALILQRQLHQQQLRVNILASQQQQQRFTQPARLSPHASSATLLNPSSMSYLGSTSTASTIPGRSLPGNQPDTAPIASHKNSSVLDSIDLVPGSVTASTSSHDSTLGTGTVLQAAQVSNEMMVGAIASARANLDHLPTAYPAMSGASLHNPAQRTNAFASSIMPQQGSMPGPFVGANSSAAAFPVAPTSPGVARAQLSSTRRQGLALALPAPMYVQGDEDTLTPYQCLLRKQIEYFLAGDPEVSGIFRGRNRKLELHQVGIRCRHCGHLPPKKRARGSMYFPCSLLGVYQSSQNLAKLHILDLCPSVPNDVRAQLHQLNQVKPATKQGGKYFWADRAEDFGIREEGDRLFI